MFQRIGERGFSSSLRKTTETDDEMAGNDLALISAYPASYGPKEQGAQLESKAIQKVTLFARAAPFLSGNDRNSRFVSCQTRLSRPDRVSRPSPICGHDGSRVSGGPRSCRDARRSSESIVARPETLFKDRSIQHRMRQICRRRRRPRGLRVPLDGVPPPTV